MRLYPIIDDESVEQNLVLAHYHQIVWSAAGRRARTRRRVHDQECRRMPLGPDG